MRDTCVFLTLLLVLATGNASAARVGTVRGELLCEGCRMFDLTIELQDMSNRIGSERVSVDSGGSFELRGMEEGHYMLTVSNQRGEVLRREPVSLRGQDPSFSVRIDRAPVQKPVSGPISLAQLRHRVPGKAQKEYERSQSKLLRGDLAGSAECLEKAIALDPEYLEAHNNLGSRYMGMGEIPKALARFRRAAELDPNAQMVQVNLAVALLQSNLLADAESAARGALRMSGTDVKAHYILGLSMYAQRKYTEETAESLERASKELPTAKLPQATQFARSGKRAAAQAMLTKYLEGPAVEKRAEAERLLSALQ